jgi:hypothetical protein
MCCKLFSCLVVDHDLVAIPLALEELEVAAHASLDERVRQVLDLPRAELPLPSVHVVSEGDGHASALGLGAEELVEGLEALAFSAHRCWHVVRLSWVSMVGLRGSTEYTKCSCAAGSQAGACDL